MLIIGDFAYAYIKSSRIELMEIVCSEAQYEKVKTDYGLYNMIRENRHIAHGHKNGIDYRIIFWDNSSGLKSLAKEFSADGDEYVVANDEVLYAIYKERAFYRCKKMSDWVKSMERYQYLTKIYISRKVVSRRGQLNMLSIVQRDWIYALPETIIKEYEYTEQTEYDENDLLEIVNPSFSYYNSIVGANNEILLTKFNLLTDSEKLKGLQDKLYMDMFTQYIIPIEIIGKKNVSKFLPYIFRKIIMYNYCRTGNTYFHAFLLDNYTTLISEFSTDCYDEFHLQIKHGSLEACK